MGANKISERTTYYKPLRGYLVTKSNPDNPSEDRMTFKFQTGSFEYAVFASIDGSINGIEIKQTEYGKMLNIFMSDVMDKFCLSMKYDSNEAIDFYNRMKAIDFSQPVQFVHWKPKDKKYYRLLTMQQKDGDKWEQVGYSFKEGEVPSWQKVQINGEDKWDKGPALKFYGAALNYVMEQVALYGNTAKRPVNEEVPSEEVSDLPF